MRHYIVSFSPDVADTLPHSISPLAGNRSPLMGYLSQGVNLICLKEEAYSSDMNSQLYRNLARFNLSEHKFPEVKMGEKGLVGSRIKSDHVIL